MGNISLSLGAASIYLYMYDVDVEKRTVISSNVLSGCVCLASALFLQRFSFLLLPTIQISHLHVSAALEN